MRGDLTRDFVQTFTDLPTGDPKENPSTATALFTGSRDEVDTSVTSTFHLAA